MDKVLLLMDETADGAFVVRDAIVIRAARVMERPADNQAVGPGWIIDANEEWHTPPLKAATGEEVTHDDDEI